MRPLLIALWAGLSLSSLVCADDTQTVPPKLLLTPQRLRRLQRDRERQTVRWTNFENRVQSVPDSPERGFELALYYAITQDEKRGREAIAWALAHKCEQRQVALVLDWCAGLITPEETTKLGASCESEVKGIHPDATLVRDSLFGVIARGGDSNATVSLGWKQLLSELRNGKFTDAHTLYADCEYLSAVRSIQRVDLRQDDPEFFSGLPVELLLSLRPEKILHPDWTLHAAALALVTLDPNLEGSQFLQGWAIEDAQIVREGPGVAYELLWADPYLPGVSYQNLDPWAYDSNGRLFARNAWTPDACWIAVSMRGVEQENCPPGLQTQPIYFGHLTLIPAVEHCAEVAHRKNRNDVVILWRMRPHQTVTYQVEKHKFTVAADEGGMWRVPENVEGRVCTQP